MFCAYAKKMDRHNAHKHKEVHPAKYLGENLSP